MLSLCRKSGATLRRLFEHGKVDDPHEPFVGGLRNPRNRLPSIKNDRLLQRIKVRRTFRAGIQMFLDSATFPRIEVGIKVLANVLVNTLASHDGFSSAAR